MAPPARSMQGPAGTEVIHHVDFKTGHTDGGTVNIISGRNIIYMVSHHRSNSFFAFYKTKSCGLELLKNAVIIINWYNITMPVCHKFIYIGQIFIVTL